MNFKYILDNYKINKKVVFTCSLLSSLFLHSCDYLDFDQSVGFKNQQEVYQVFGRAQQSLTNIYSYLDSDFGSIDGAMRDCATDDAFYVWSNSDIRTFTNGSWGPTKAIDAQWSSNYSGIRAANQFLKSMSETDFSKYKWNSDYETWMEKLQYWTYEARFLRSLYLFELARRYGDIPFAVNIYNVDNVNTLKKTSFNDIINFISNECSEIAPKLPLTYNDVTGKQTGRATRGAALALKAKALLYTASPLFSEDNQTKWINAAKAAKEVMDLNQYSIVDENSVNNLNSKELILERRVAASCDFEKKNFPISFDKGKTGTCPSENLVDAFQTINGYDVQLTENGWKCDDPKFDASHPYDNRDKRFAKTIIRDESVFKGKLINCTEGGDEGPLVNGASPTSYYLKKYVIENVDLSPVEKSMNHYWVLFRYSEILLNYAEAMNNAYGPDATAEGLTMSALEALNIIRTRAGLPALSKGMNKKDFKVAFIREKRCEFAFENQRFWDIRRWKIGKDTQNKIDGVRIVVDGDTKKYSRVVVDRREWNDKMNLYPIPINELYRNPNLNPQNKGW